jgi:hypothetical protein
MVLRANVMGRKLARYATAIAFAGARPRLRRFSIKSKRFGTKVLGRLVLEKAHMASTKNEALVGREVERLFSEISAKRGDLCTNPVTDGKFVYGFDSIKRQKDAAYKRLLVRQYFALYGPPDAPRMPTDDYERNRDRPIHLVARKSG